MPETEPVVVAPVMSKTAPTPVDVDHVTDVAAFLPRREYKIHGGQISDSDLSFNSLCKQIDEGLNERFTEAEIIRTVLNIIKPGTFKNMLITKESLTVDELKRFLRAHLRDKSSSELCQELRNARQNDRECPQQFMDKLMRLKQRGLFASRQSAGFQYDSKQVQGVFLHSFYQGMNEKYAYIRRDIKPHISNMSVTDDFFLEITRSVSEDSERQNRLGQTHKPRSVSMQHSRIETDRKLFRCRQKYKLTTLPYMQWLWLRR